jgi:hypothetical protein
MYWQIGKLIVEDKQAGKSRATYGKAVDSGVWGRF